MCRIVISTFIIFGFLTVGPTLGLANDSSNIEINIQKILKPYMANIKKQDTYDKKYAQFVIMVNFINAEYKKYSDSIYEMVRAINEPGDGDKSAFIKKRDDDQVFLEKWSAIQVAFEIPSKFFIEKSKNIPTACETIEADIRSSYTPRAAVDRKIELSKMTQFAIDLAVSISLDLCKNRISLE